MEITASLVKDLREKTGVGMMQCKKALQETNGNFEEAIKFLREKGLAAAAKKSSREQKEGRVFTVVTADRKKGIIVELNCETDFVSGNNDFIEFGNTITENLLNAPVSTVEEAQNININGKSLKDTVSEAVLKIGENISLKSFERYEAAYLQSYVHLNGKIGVLVGFDKVLDEDKAKDIAMHIAASNPLYTESKDVPESDITNEKEIIRTQALNEGKPEKILDNIINGRIQKYYKDICLLEQPFVKDDKITVKSVLGDVNVSRFTRISLVKD